MAVLQVGYGLGWLLAGLAALMLIPMGVAAGFEEKRALQSFLVALVSSGFIGISLVLALRRHARLDMRRSGLVLLAIAWIGLPVVAAWPIVWSNVLPSWTLAYFEALSSFTTTGATVLDNVTTAPRSIVVWRAVLQWLGGLVTLLGAAFIMAPISSAENIGQASPVGARQFAERFSSFGLIRLPPALLTIAIVYALLTLSCIVALALCRLPILDAFCIALSTVSTGGMMPTSAAIETYGSRAALIVVSLFMLAGSVSIFWLRAHLSLRPMPAGRLREPITILIAVCALAVGLSFVQVQAFTANGAPDLRTLADSLLAGFSTAASLISTTGIETSRDVIASIPIVILLAICFIGGGTLSTAGGFKFFRFSALLTHTGRELQRLIYPHSVASSEFGDERSRSRAIMTIWINLSLLTLAIVAITLLLAIEGIELVPGLVAAVTAIANIGPAYALAGGPDMAGAPTFREMSTTAQFTLCAGMVLGRLEALALFGLISLALSRE